MKAIVDDKIPYIADAIERLADEVVYVPGREFTPALVADADVLVVRTRTRCGRELLEGSKVRLIATATIGFDHIDTLWCAAHGVSWVNCPGCNAASVEQYVHSSLILLSRRHNRGLKGMTLGVVGVGNVGRRVAAMASAMGMKVLLNDPPRADAEGAARFVTLDEIAREADVITFHTPLSRGGAYPTYHLADDRFFASLRRHPWLLNTSRGEVVETSAVKDALQGGQIADAVIDVWENEPDIDLELMDKTFIATPHIAGYSADGKANASRMVMEAISRFFNLNATFDIAPPVPQPATIHAATTDDALLEIYNPLNDCKALREDPSRFEWLRGNYPLRREPGAYEIILGK